MCEAVTKEFLRDERVLCFAEKLKRVCTACSDDWPYKNFLSAFAEELREDVMGRRNAVDVETRDECNEGVGSVATI